MCAIIGAENHQVEDWCKTATQNALNQRSNQTDTSLPGYAVNCTVEPANFNAPGQIVVSGSVDALSELETLISNLGIKGVMAKRLNVSAPFHSSLMNAARAAMETIFEKANKNGKLNAMTVPYIPNRTARLLQDSGLVFELLSEQMDHSVLWSQSIETLFQMNVTKAYEFGPGKVLQGLAKRIAKKSGATFEVTAIYDLETLKQAEANQS